MDYDGADQHQVTHLGALASLSPRISPDGCRIAFSSYPKGSGLEIMMYSNELGAHGHLPAIRRNQCHASMVAGWNEDGIRLVDAGLDGDLRF